MITKSRFNKISGVLLILSLAILACGLSSGCRQKKPLSQKTKIKIGIIPITDCAQVYVAKHTGAFERHGLDVEFVPLAGGATILQALGAGSVDIAFSNLMSVQYYERNVGKLHRLAGGTLMNAEHSEAGLVVRMEVGINSLTDLRGKTIAVNTLRNIVDLAVSRALRNNGISVSDIHLVELPFKDMEIALRGGRIDAATLPEPILSRAMAAGGLKNLGDHFALAFKEMYSTGYFTLPKNISTRKDVFQRFDKAIIEVTSKTNSYNSDVLKAISESTKVSESDLQNSGRPLFVESLPNSAMEQMRDWMIEEGFIEH